MYWWLKRPSFSCQFLTRGRMFKTGYSHTKMGLMKQQNQTEAASPGSQAALQQLCTTFQGVNDNSRNAGLQNLPKDVYSGL